MNALGQAKDVTSVNNDNDSGIAAHVTDKSMRSAIVCTKCECNRRATRC